MRAKFLACRCRNLVATETRARKTTSEVWAPWNIHSSSPSSSRYHNLSKRSTLSLFSKLEDRRDVEGCISLWHWAWWFYRQSPDLNVWFQASKQRPYGKSEPDNRFSTWMSRPWSDWCAEQPERRGKSHLQSCRKDNLVEIGETIS